MSEQTVDQFRAAYYAHKDLLAQAEEPSGELASAVRQKAIEVTEQKLAELAIDESVQNHYDSLSLRLAAESLEIDRVIETVKALGSTVVQDLLREREEQLAKDPDYEVALFYQTKKAEPRRRDSVEPKPVAPEVAAEVSESPEKSTEVEIRLLPHEKMVQIGRKKILAGPLNELSKDWSQARLKALELLSGGSLVTKKELWEGSTGEVYGRLVGGSAFVRALGDWLLSKEMRYRGKPVVVKTGNTKSVRYQLNPSLNAKLIHEHQNEAAESINKPGPVSQKPINPVIAPEAEGVDPLLPNKMEAAALIGFIRHMLRPMSDLGIPTMSPSELADIQDRLGDLKNSGADLEKLRANAVIKLGHLFEDETRLKQIEVDLDADDPRLDLVIYAMSLTTEHRQDLIYLLQAQPREEKVFGRGRASKQLLEVKVYYDLPDNRSIEYRSFDDNGEINEVPAATIANKPPAVSQEDAELKPQMDPDPDYSAEKVSSEETLNKRIGRFIKDHLDVVAERGWVKGAKQSQLQTAFHFLTGPYVRQASENRLIKSVRQGGALIGPEGVLDLAALHSFREEFKTKPFQNAYKKAKKKALRKFHSEQN